jgi:diguanylate cyclase (GGDEF)-like protein
MAEHKQDFQAQLAELRNSYIRQLPERLGQIQRHWHDLLAGNGDHEMLRTLHRMVHSLTGSGATFGFVALSDKARALERILKGMVESDAGTVISERGVIETALAELETAIASAGSGGLASASANSALYAARQTHIPVDSRLIFFLEDDLLTAKELKLQLGHFGYMVRVFSRIKGVEEAILENLPALVIIDINLPDGNGAEAFIAMMKVHKWSVPLIFISAQMDFQARLAAVRANGIAFFSKPVDIGALVDRLDAVTSARGSTDYKILIVDDSTAVAEYHAGLLREAGMLVNTLSDPTRAMEVLTDFNPDMILMDVYMPECSGLELAAVLRQQDVYLSLPIVFLSSETDISKQLSALGLGGDDFLTKPIDPQRLVSTVMARADRARAMRGFMVHDSLTGLLNHTAIKDALDREIANATRHKTSLSVALIDIDHFKKINDAHGHQAGDRVLKSIARLLQQRLRKVDYIGRYGGEEFAVILPNTDGETSLRVLNTLRGAFASISHQAGDGLFSCTFSGGVAVFTQGMDAQALIKQADVALYRAKDGGRNRIQFSS